MDRDFEEMTEAELAAYFYEHRDDPKEWGEPIPSPYPPGTKFNLSYKIVLTREVLDAIYDPYLITGDKNIVHMEIAVTYRRDDPDAWLNTVGYDAGENPGAGKREEGEQADKGDRHRPDFDRSRRSDAPA